MSAVPTGMAAVNQPAPPFDLPCTEAGVGHRRANLGDYRGRWLALLFYPKDFSFICPTELTALSNRIEEFKQRGCDLLGVSTDSLETHDAWIATPKAQGGLGGLRFPLASDADGAVCRAYGVYVPFQHVALRGLFLIDPNSILQFAVVHNLSVGRKSDELLRVLAALQTGGLCPENWSEGQTPLDLSATLGPGSVIGSYRILERLGSGSFGTVFKAYDATLERVVALKVLRAGDPTLMQKVLGEARAAAAIQHAHVCTVYAVENSEGTPLITMEYVAGEPLSQTLGRGALPVDVLRRIGAQIAEGMAAAHAHGVVHGDLKPANIMVTVEGLVKIMDFGMARRERRANTEVDLDATLEAPKPDDRSTGLSGTPAYMAPEQTLGMPASRASDVFSLGLILAEMATGRRVFQASNLAELLRQIELIRPDEIVAPLPPPLRELAQAMLEPQVSSRTVTMREVAEQLSE